jgi:hypothetical protein
MHEIRFSCLSYQILDQASVVLQKKAESSDVDVPIHVLFKCLPSFLQQMHQLTVLPCLCLCALLDPKIA